MLSGRYDLVIFDEINIALDYGLLPLEEVLQMLEERLAQADVVLTGRNAPQEIIDAADLVSEVREIKHPYCNGVRARKGMEF
ncbi:MAG: Cob(I)yrinic acid a,c-diamide adenosyltransferase [Chloroflexi bacterium]|nr:Cob(I)yrinic acid a,c-diamide adenosyltransferase [Chloroflexota bacterium]